MADKTKPVNETVKEPVNEPAKVSNEDLVAKVAELEAQIKKSEGISPTDQDAYLNERIPFIARMVSKEDTSLFVAVNGRNFLIQRGKTVMLPRYVVHHLENVDAQKTRVLELQLEFQEQLNSPQLA